jgi:hypothetical protein
MKKIISIFILLLTLISCGNNQEKTNATFSASFAVGFANAGMMVYGRNLTYPKISIARQIFENGQGIDNLPNGEWKFWAVAWKDETGVGAPMTGVAKCAIVPSVYLKGSNVDIKLLFSSKTCFLEEFGPIGSKDIDNGFKDLKFSDCMNHDAIRTPLKFACAKGAVKSIQVLLPQRYPDGTVTLNGAVTSNCISITSLGTTTGLHVPFFTESDVRVHGFSDTGCSSTSSLGEVREGRYTNYLLSVGHLLTQFSYCSGPSDLDPDARRISVSETGTYIDGYHLICTAEQLDTFMKEKIGKTGNNAVFGRSIYADKLSSGNNTFQVTGRVLDFFNEFNGNGFAVHNLNLTESVSQIGLFSKISAGIVKNLAIIGAYAKVADLNGSTCQMGILAGESANVNNVIENILIKDSFVYVEPNCDSLSINNGVGVYSPFPDQKPTITIINSKITKL